MEMGKELQKNLTQIKNSCIDFCMSRKLQLPPFPMWKPQIRISILTGITGENVEIVSLSASEFSDLKFTILEPGWVVSASYIIKQ